MSAFSLPGILDTAAAAPLRQELLALVDRREPVALDGAAVVQAGQACLQVIASAAATAAAAGLPYALHAPSDALREVATLSGLDTIFAALDGRSDR